MNGVSANPVAQVGNEEKGVWHKRLRLRKNSFSFPTEQNTVKEENNVTGESKKQMMNTFTCSSCNDGIFFKPAELIMHFKIVHGGKGSPPMFPCNMCGFSASVFTTLQQHRMKHQDCLFSCEICEDNVQQTLPQLTKHIQTHHSLNGQYYCPKCKFSMQEIEQFVCHSCPPPIKTNHEESIAYGKLGAEQKNNLLQHMAAACRQRWSRRNWWRKRATSSKEDDNLSQELKFLLPKPEPQWASTLLPLSTPGLLDNHGILLDPEKTLEETKRFLERTVGFKKWPVSFKDERDRVPPALTTQSKAKHKCTPHPTLQHIGKDKLTGLMEKNNISVPPDCTTKVVRFKMVDGKKHLVLKVIPSNKQDSVESRSHTVKETKPNDISSGNCSDPQVTSESTLSLRKNPSRGVAQQRFLDSVVEKIKSQQNFGCNNQEPADCSTSINLRSKRVKNSQEKALSESEENFTACQGDSGCHSDLTSDASSAAFEKDHSLALDSKADLCSTFGFDCISPSSRSPLEDLTVSLSHFQSEDGGLLFHSTTEESTNNLDPRDALLPVGQYDCGRETLSASDLYQTVDELPLTTVRHLLDEVRVDHSISSRTSCDEPQRDLRGITSIFPLLDEDSNSSTSVPESAAGSIASLSRKRMGEASSTDSQEPACKSQKRSTSSVLHWEPAPRDTPSTLRLIPFNSSQSVQIPTENQPVIVLNHPDSDIPEVTNIMKVIHKHKGAVRRVVLSRKTLKALSEFNCNNLIADCHASQYRREWPNGTVKERFSLKLRLKRVCGRKYTVVPTVSESTVLQPTFRCWFCGRLFRDQETWVGHGQRHLMEATRGWNQFFNA